MVMAPSTTFSPPDILHFNVGSTHSSSASPPPAAAAAAATPAFYPFVATKLIKKVKKKRLPIKRSFWKSVKGQAAKSASRKSMLTRSSLLRQGKFAEARSRSKDGKLPNETRD